MQTDPTPNETRDAELLAIVNEEWMRGTALARPMESVDERLLPWVVAALRRVYDLRKPTLTDTEARQLEETLVGAWGPRCRLAIREAIRAGSQYAAPSVDVEAVKREAAYEALTQYARHVEGFNWNHAPTPSGIRAYARDHFAPPSPASVTRGVALRTGLDVTYTVDGTPPWSFQEAEGGRVRVYSILSAASDHYCFDDAEMGALTKLRADALAASVAGGGR